VSAYARANPEAPEYPLERVFEQADIAREAESK
jgi:hypothetical protein